MTLLIAMMGFSLAIAAVDSAANALVPRLALGSETLLTDVQDRTCTRDERGWRYMRGESRIRGRPSRRTDWIGIGASRTVAAAGGITANAVGTIEIASAIFFGAISDI